MTRERRRVLRRTLREHRSHPWTVHWDGTGWGFGGLYVWKCARCLRPGENFSPLTWGRNR